MGPQLFNIEDWQPHGASVAFVFDFDGTLAPIVMDPDVAWPRASTIAAFSELTRIAPCAIVSGRGRADVLARLPELALTHVAGNHGLEWTMTAADAADPRVAAWRDALAHELDGEAGLEIEDKVWSLAVHYRRAPDPARASRRIESAVAHHSVELGGARFIGGDHVWNLLPAHSGDKGDAIIRIARELGVETLVFVGDDVTDELAFAVAERADLGFELIGIRVGYDPESRARYYVPEQARIERLIEGLARAASSALSRARPPQAAAPGR